MCGGAVEVDVAAEVVEEFLADGEAEAEVLGAVFGGEAGVEDVGSVEGVDAAAVVLDVEVEGVVLGVVLASDGDGVGGGRG